MSEEFADMMRILENPPQPSEKLKQLMQSGKLQIGDATSTPRQVAAWGELAELHLGWASRALVGLAERGGPPNDLGRLLRSLRQAVGNRVESYLCLQVYPVTDDGFLEDP